MNFILPLLVLVVLVDYLQEEESLQDPADFDRSCWDYIAHSYLHDNLAENKFDFFCKYPMNNIFASVIVFSASITYFESRKPVNSK